MTGLGDPSIAEVVDVSATETGYPLPFLRFTGCPAGYLAADWLGFDVVGWTGHWPPPPLVIIAIGRRTGEIAYIDPGDVDADVLREVLSTGSIAVTHYIRVSYSELPPDVGPNVARGAEYAVLPA